MVARIDGEVFTMEGSEPCEIVVVQKTSCACSATGEDGLSALSPSERKNLLTSFACHKEMLDELAKM
jgi:hypothetical protein